MTYTTLRPATRDVLDWLEERAIGRNRIEHLCENEGSIREGGISTPGAQSHRLTFASADPADPREGRGVVVRGSDE